MRQHPITQLENEQRARLRVVAKTLVDSINNNLPPIQKVNCPLCSKPNAKQETLFSHITTGLKACYVHRISCGKCDKTVTIPVK